MEPKGGATETPGLHVEQQSGSPAASGVPSVETAEEIEVLNEEDWAVRAGESKLLVVAHVHLSGGTYSICMSQTDGKLSCTCPRARKGSQCDHVPAVFEALKAKGLV
jgi:hypothetical protein